MTLPLLPLTGRDLTPAEVEQVALRRRPVALAAAAERRLAASRAVVEPSARSAPATSACWRTSGWA